MCLKLLWVYVSMLLDFILFYRTLSSSTYISVNSTIFWKRSQFFFIKFLFHQKMVKKKRGKFIFIFLTLKCFNTNISHFLRRNKNPKKTNFALNSLRISVSSKIFWKKISTSVSLTILCIISFYKFLRSIKKHNFKIPPEIGDI